MRKLTSYCIATTALLALTLSAHASPGSAMARAAGWYSASGVGPVILVADEKKPVDEKKAVDEKKVDDEKKAGDEKKVGDDKKAADNKKKSHRERTVSKQQIMRHIRQYVPPEYQDYIQQGGMGGGMDGGAVKY